MSITFHHISSTDSTQKEIFNFLPHPPIFQNAPFGVVALRADQQVHGRGQRDHKWCSESGANLLTSLYIEPPALHPRNQFIISQITALALHDTISKYVVDTPIYIKWPNDLYIREKKVAGILIEHAFQSAEIHHSVIGIGLNLNQVQFPSSLPNPTSLLLETGLSLSIEEVFQELLSHFISHYQKIHHSKTIKELYHKHLYLRGWNIQLEHQSQIYSAQITGVDSFGQLLVATDTGEEFAIHDSHGVTIRTI